MISGLFFPGSEKLADGGRVSFCMPNSTLIMLAAPAPVNRWPIMDLMDPMGHSPADQSRPSQRVRILANSTASPTGVPVPWHSIRSTSRGDQPT